MLLNEPVGREGQLEYLFTRRAAGTIDKPRLPRLQPLGPAKGGKPARQGVKGSEESDILCGVGGSESERGWNYEEGVAGQRLASREDRWTEDN